jgi:uncharacterized membrane protein
LKIDTAKAQLTSFGEKVSRDQLVAGLPSVVAMISQGSILLTNLIGGSKTKDDYEIVLGAIGLVLIAFILILLIRNAEDDTNKVISGAIWVFVSIITAYLGSTSVNE